MHHNRAPALVLAVHGTRSASGARTTIQIAEAVRAARPDLQVELAYLDVQAPSLDDVLGRLRSASVTVPLLLARGYHVQSDIPQILTEHPGTRMSAPLGPDPLVVEALADRLLAAEPVPAQETLLAAVPSSREDARADAATAADLLSERLGRPVRPVSLGSDARAALVGTRERTVSIAPYLIAPGTFLEQLRTGAGSTPVAEPLGPHPAIIRLTLDRYTSVLGPGIGPDAY